MAALHPLGARVRIKRPHQQRRRDSTLVAVTYIAFGPLHVRPTGSTCGGEPNEIKTTTYCALFNSLIFDGVVFNRYGTSGAGSQIKPNNALMFVMEIVKVHVGEKANMCVSVAR